MEGQAQKETFLAKFRRDSVLVLIPFLEPGQSPSPITLGGPVCTTITTAFSTQVEELVDDIKRLCHWQDHLKLKLINLYSAYYNQAMPFLKCLTILTYNFPAQTLSTVSFLYEGEPPPPISTPWRAYRPQGCL